MKKEKVFWGVLLPTSACFIIVTTCLLMMVIYPFHVEEIKKRGRETLQHLQFVLPLLEPVQRQLYLEDVSRHNRELSYLLLMDINGKALVHSNPRRVGMVFDGLDVKRCIESGDQIEQIYTRDRKNPSSPHHNEKVIDIMTPYYAGDGSIVGAVSVGISLNAVQSVKEKYYIVAALCTACWVLFISVFAVVHYRSMLQRQKVDTALRESEERFHTIFNECPIPITLSEVPGGTYVDVNRQYLNEAAFEREEVVGETALSLGFIEPAEAERIKCLLYSNDKLDNEEIETRGRNGEPKTSLLSVRFITISGKPFALSMLQDITERKQYEDKLARSEANYRNLFENAPIGVFQSTIEGRFGSVNKSFSDMFGYEDPEDVLKSITNIGTQVYAHQEDRSAILKQVLAAHSVVCEDLEFLHKDGSPLFVTLHTRAVRNPNGQIEILEGFVVDTTERKRAFEALKEREERLRLYVQRLPLPCIVFVNDWTIKSWNPAAEEVFGYSEQEALDRSANDLIIPAHEHARVDGILQQILAGATTANTVGENTTKDGRTIACEWTNTLLRDNSGHIIGILSIAQDITEKTQARELLIQHEKMMMIGGLAAGMAHEINNPLSIIIQSAQIIEERLNISKRTNCDIAEVIGVELDLIYEYLKQREIFDFLANIRRSGERTAKIVRNMLSFSRKGFLEHRPANINMIIEHALEMTANDYDIKKNYDFRKISIERVYSEGLPYVIVDATEIEQVLINLLKNAGMALADNNMMKTPIIKVTTFREDDDLLIKLADNGPGMSKETTKRIFEPFFTTKEVGTGTGLGLYVSYLIVTNNHKGQIIVDSTPGQGTVFTIRLPLSRE